MAAEQNHGRLSDSGQLPAVDPRGTEMDNGAQPLVEKSANSDHTELQPVPDVSEARDRSGRPSSTENLTLSQDDVEQERAQTRSAFDRARAPFLSGYCALHKLGAGTYGEVWLYEELRTRIRVAIKFFRHGRGERWQQLQAEIHQLALLHADPGIMQLEDVEPHADPPYYIMRYAEGGSLLARLEDGKVLPPDEALRIFREAATALAYVHAKGIRHCDLKPGNLLFDSRGRVLLADFGQAHLSDDASPALGTYFYMAPEQADLLAGIPDTRWDVYGLGALLYHMLTGRPPREDEQLRAELDATANLTSRLRLYREAIRRSPRPTAHYRVGGMDGRLARVLDACLEIDPEKRLRDAGEVLDALDKRRRARRRTPLLLFGLVAPLLLLSVFALLTHWALNDSVTAASQTLADRVQQSDLVSARLVAYVVADQLNDRIHALQKLRDNGGMEDHLAERHWGEIQDQLKGWIVQQQHEDSPGNELFFRLGLADRHGWIRADYPEDPAAGTRTKWWGWRDWFHGNGDQHAAKDHPEQPFEPLQVEHVSHPFIARIQASPRVIVLSVPCFAPPQPGNRQGPAREVSGILIGLVEIKKVYKWIEAVDMGSNGFAVLINERGQYLLHHAKEKIRPALDHNPPTWLESVPALRQVLDQEEGTLEYTDPIDGQCYLAGHTRVKVGNSTWGVLVQHQKDSALRPVEHLQQSATTWGWLLVGVAMALVFGMWGWLIGLLRREERFGHG